MNITILESFHNTPMRESDNELIATLGKPSSQSNNDHEKVNFEGDCEIKDCYVVTIYDWEEGRYRPISKDDLIE